MLNLNNIDRSLSRVGLGLIGAYCMLCSIFWASFAQIHLHVHFLPFPIFIGEILLFICLVLLLVICENSVPLSRTTVTLLLFYFGWVFLRTLHDYYVDGPLACRNAALFYYPIFAVFGYCFYQKADIHPRALKFLACIVFVILLLQAVMLYYWWTYLLLFTLAVLKLKTNPWRWLGRALLALVLVMGHQYFYEGSRSHVIGVFATIVFMSFYFGSIFMKRRQFFILGVSLAAVIFYLVVFSHLGSRNAVSSLTSLKQMMDTYRTSEDEYRRHEGGYVPQKLKVNLYNDKSWALFHSQNRPQCPMPTSVVVKNTPSQVSPTVAKPVSLEKSVCPQKSPQKSAYQGKSQLNLNLHIISQGIFYRRIKEERVVGVEEGNIVFRFFVWRDMLQELITRRAWWGFSFGHPQRSKSLEVLHWAEGEWSRDGWIMPHNSYIHIIYRSGILGIGLIAILLYLTAKLTWDFFLMNSVEGGLLVAILMYWFILSNFLVILEFPYNAIPIWTIFGISWAYRKQLKTKEEKLI